MKDEPIIVERTFPAPIGKVWDALTDPEQMRKWYFPTIKDFRAVPCFETAFDVLSNGKTFLHIWKVAAVITHKKISYDWKYGGYPGNSLVTFELSETKEGTKLVLTHEKLASFRGDLHPELIRENFQQGWTGFMGTALKHYLDIR